LVLLFTTGRWRNEELRDWEKERRRKGKLIVVEGRSREGRGKVEGRSKGRSREGRGKVEGQSREVEGRSRDDRRRSREGEGRSREG
jgi:hypothetical protein